MLMALSFAALEKDLQKSSICADLQEEAPPVAARSGLAALAGRVQVLALGAGAAVAGRG